MCLHNFILFPKKLMIFESQRLPRFAQNTIKINQYIRRKNSFRPNLSVKGNLNQIRYFSRDSKFRKSNIEFVVDPNEKLVKGLISFDFFVFCTFNSTTNNKIQEKTINQSKLLTRTPFENYLYENIKVKS